MNGNCATKRRRREEKEGEGGGNRKREREAGSKKEKKGVRGERNDDFLLIFSFVDELQ